jgi:hypothetical protein
LKFEYANVQSSSVIKIVSPSRRPSPPPSSPPQPPQRPSDNNGPPQRPFRLESSADFLYDELEESALMHAISNVPTHRRFSVESSLPQKPERIESLAELSFDDDSSHIAIRVSPAIETSSCPTTRRPKPDNQGPPQTPVKVDSSAVPIDDYHYAVAAVSFDRNCAHLATNIVAINSTAC